MVRVVMRSTVDYATDMDPEELAAVTRDYRSRYGAGIYEWFTGVDGDVQDNVLLIGPEGYEEEVKL